MTGLDFHSTLQLIKDAPRPVTLVFVIPNGSSDRSSEQAAEALPSDVLESEYRAEQQVVASTVPPNAIPAQLPTRRQELLVPLPLLLLCQLAAVQMETCSSLGASRVLVRAAVCSGGVPSCYSDVLRPEAN